MLLFVLAINSSSANALLGKHKMEKFMLISILSVAGMIYTDKIKHDYHDFLDNKKGSLKEFLDTQPELQEKIENTLRKRMKEAKTEKAYIIYQKAADRINMSDIPPFKGEDFSIYNAPGLAKHEYSSPNKLENPENASDYPNYITNPEGEKIDTRLDFPFEEPKNWEEYILLEDDSKKLGRSLEKAGIKKTNHSAAHHVIPVNAKSAKKAIERMHDYGIEANDAENGIWLPQAGLDNNNHQSSAVGLIHSGRHPDIYVRNVNNQITAIPKDLPTEEGKQKIIQIIDNIKEKLYSATQPEDTWYNVLDEKDK